MSKRKIKQFLQKISSFRQVARITRDFIPGDCKFIADPFIQYDPVARLWVLFAEVAFPARRQYIGLLTSPDLRNWQYHGDAVKGSRESFPCITQKEGHYLMTPCVDASPAPGLISFYRAESLLGPWRFASQLVLRKRVNDRVLLPCQTDDRHFLIYGTKTRLGSVLEYLELKMHEERFRIVAGSTKVLLRNHPVHYLKNKVFGSPRLIMRPAGALIPDENGFILPLQGTRKGGYGECIALAYFIQNGIEIKFAAHEFINFMKLCPEFVASHHFSFSRHETIEVFALDGHANGADWEVRIFALE